MINCFGSFLFVFFFVVQLIKGFFNVFAQVIKKYDDNTVNTKVFIIYFYNLFPNNEINFK